MFAMLRGPKNAKKNVCMYARHSVRPSVNVILNRFRSKLLSLIGNGKCKTIVEDERNRFSRSGCIGRRGALQSSRKMWEPDS